MTQVSQKVDLDAFQESNSKPVSVFCMQAIQAEVRGSCLEVAMLGNEAVEHNWES